MGTYEPKIIAFLCTWCSYTGADSAGTARLKSPWNVRAVRVPCSGRVSPELVLQAFDQGADGVIVLGCHIGECHYESGNHRAAKRIPILKSLLEFVGLESERLRLDWVSASEGERFARIVSEFTEEVKALGPIHWRVEKEDIPATLPAVDLQPGRNGSEKLPVMDVSWEEDTAQMRKTACDLLSSGEVDTVLGYELGPRGRTRPAFISHPENTERLVWNAHATHNLTRYIKDELEEQKDEKRRVAVIVKPCDAKTLNVLLAKHTFSPHRVHAIGMICPGIEQGAGFGGQQDAALQERCQVCTERVPLVYDTLIGDPDTVPAFNPQPRGAWLENWQDTDPTQRMEFWLSHFDRCIRCYACRDACPVCDCSPCLYEQDDSLWTGLNIEINQKRAFHLGRAYHLAGRCVGCDECVRVCPMDIPLNLLNDALRREVEAAFNYQPGLNTQPSPLTTVLDQEKLS